MLGNGASIGTIQQTVGNTANSQVNGANGHSNTRDSSWLKLAVCPTFLAGTCPHSRDDCEGAHPGPNIRMENGTVTVCFDHMKRGECKHPSCKYFHVSDKQKSIVEKQGGSHRPNSSTVANISPGPSVSQPLNFALGTASTSFAQPRITPETLLSVLKRGGQFPFHQMPSLNQHPLVPYLHNFAMGQNVQENILPAYAPGLPLNDPSYLTLATYQAKRATELSIESALNSVLGTKRPADGNGSELLTPPLKRHCQEPAPPAMPNQYFNGDAATNLFYSTQLPGGNYTSNGISCSTAYPPTTHFTVLPEKCGTQSFQTRCALFTEDGKTVESVEVCRDFLAGRCSRAANCNYLHVENVKNFEVVNNKVQICREAISGQCSRDRCRRYHIPREILAKYVTVHGYDNKESSKKLPESAAVDLSSNLNRITSNSNSARSDSEFQSLGQKGAPQSPQSSDHHSV
nr:muscleblind protein 2 [Hymenolepis microstoma]